MVLSHVRAPPFLPSAACLEFMRAKSNPDKSGLPYAGKSSHRRRRIGSWHTLRVLGKGECDISRLASLKVAATPREGPRAMIPLPSPDISHRGSRPQPKELALPLSPPNLTSEIDPWAGKLRAGIFLQSSLPLRSPHFRLHPSISPRGNLPAPNFPVSSAV